MRKPCDTPRAHGEEKKTRYEESLLEEPVGTRHNFVSNAQEKRTRERETHKRREMDNNKAERVGKQKEKNEGIDRKT